MNNKSTIAAFLLTVGGVLASALFAPSLAMSAEAIAAQQIQPAERNKQIVDEAFDRWEKGNGRFFDEVLASDVVWTINGSGPSAGTFEGRANFIGRAVRPFASRLSTPVRPIARKVWAQGDDVIINWEGEGVARDGLPYRNSYVWILRMQGGRAVEVSAYLDLVPYDDVLRRIPAPEAQEERS